MGGEIFYDNFQGAPGGPPIMAIFAGSPLWVPRKLRNFFSSKLWHVAYQISGIFDGEFIYGTHFVENQHFEENLDQKFGPKIQKKSKFWKINFFFKLWHAAVVAVMQSSIMPVITQTTQTNLSV